MAHGDRAKMKGNGNRDLWSRRPSKGFAPAKSPFAKKITRRMERQGAKKDVRNGEQ